MRKWIIIAAIAGFFCADAAYGQDQHVAYYKLYNEALEAGDRAAALKNAEAAWRAAEDELGDQQTTAVLAYNYAWLVYPSDQASAIEPLERVIAIVGEDSGLFGDEIPKLMLDYVRAVVSTDDRALKRKLTKTLEETEESNPSENLLSARAWFHISSYEMTRNRFDSAETAATASLRHYAPYREQTPKEVASVLIARGISKVARNNRDNIDIVEANQDFYDAVALFPPQQDIETFDPLLAAAMAWDSAAYAAARSDNPGRAKLGSRIVKKPPELAAIDTFQWATPRPTVEECNLQWKTREPPKFPQRDANRGYLGAVLIGYHFEGNEVTGVKLLAEVPERSDFAEIALESVEDWRLETAPAKECRRNNLTNFLFVLR